VEILLDRNPLKEPLDEASHPHMWVNSARYNYDAAEMLGRRPTMEDAFALRGTFMGMISNPILVALLTIIPSYQASRIWTISACTTAMQAV